MREWKSQLEDYKALLKSLMDNSKKESTQLRFDRLFIPVSDIAAQYFCEKKVEMQHLHGEVETEEKTIGAKAHEKLLADSMKIKRQELWKRIYGREPVFAFEMFLLAKYYDIVLGGRPDSVLFQRGYPEIIFEYKFSKSGIAYLTYHVQARTYGILLRNMGFDISRLFYAVVIVDPVARKDKDLKYNVIDAVFKNGPKEATMKIKNAHIYLRKFDQDQAEKDLDWAMGFWRNSREAQSTSNMNKCKNCVYREECGKSTNEDLSSF